MRLHSAAAFLFISNILVGRSAAASPSECDDLCSGEVRPVIPAGTSECVDPNIEANNCGFANLVKACLDEDGEMSDSCPYEGNISCWDTSEITNMRTAFKGQSKFNKPLCWETGSVTDMYQMFKEATAFDKDVNHWDVSNVKYTMEMFYGASAFNKPLDEWDTSSLLSTLYMFRDAIAFDHDLKNWDVSDVSHMGGMFQGATSFNKNLNDWDISKVTNMFYMFNGAESFDQCLRTWAEKTPSDVSTFGMLKGTSCPKEKDPKPDKGPWCQTDRRCKCKDRKNKFKVDGKKKSCDWVAKKKTEERCEMAVGGNGDSSSSDDGSKKVKDKCPEACGYCS